MSSLLRFLLLALALLPVCRAAAQESAPVDTALIVSVDVSGSVDERRYSLQMDGIAKALEDSEVIAAMLSGPNASTLFTMVEWSDQATTAIPWTRIASREDALAVAARVRRLRRPEGEFTCVAHMMRYVSDLTLPLLPVKARRVVMDVSGDGLDNCDGDKATAEMRDNLVAAGMIINGLPINEGDPNQPIGAGAFRAPGRPFEDRSNVGEIRTLEPWYRKNVIGGFGAFLIPANGYKDFERAIRQKFAVEISGWPLHRAQFGQLSSSPFPR